VGKLIAELMLLLPPQFLPFNARTCVKGCRILKPVLQHITIDLI
jgi:hypothetical protein